MPLLVFCPSIRSRSTRGSEEGRAVQRASRQCLRTTGCILFCGAASVGSPRAIAADGSEAHFISADVRDPEASEQLIAAVLEQHGRLDILVNNAGGGPPVEAATATPALTEKIVALNLVAPLVLAQQAHTALSGGEHPGVIINIASVSGVRPSPGSTAYGAAKAGLVSAEGLGNVRKYAIVGILVLAAIVTPPDVITQVILFVVVYGLYEISIFLVRRVETKRDEQLRADGYYDDEEEFDDPLMKEFDDEKETK